MNFFDHKDLGNHLLQFFPKVVKHPVYLSFAHLGVPNKGICLVSYAKNLFCKKHIRHIYFIMNQQMPSPDLYY
jgi:hypothetical protein